MNSRFFSCALDFDNFFDMCQTKIFEDKHFHQSKSLAVQLINIHVNVSFFTKKKIELIYFESIDGKRKGYCRGIFQNDLNFSFNLFYRT